MMATEESSLWKVPSLIVIITFGPHYEDVFGWLGGSLGSVKRRAKQRSHVRPLLPLMRGMPKDTHHIRPTYPD